MNGWIEVPKIGLIKVHSIVRVGIVRGDPAYETYRVYLSCCHDFEVLECDMTRESFVSLIAWEEQSQKT